MNNGGTDENELIVTGMVLLNAPAGEYDRRVVLLTREMGKITCFARRSRRPGNALMAATQPFAFGRFTLKEGRSAYSIAAAEISNYFQHIGEDMERACYGTYFLEVMEYLTHENNDEAMLLLLLYRSLRALESASFDNRLVRAVFEIKAIALEGELQEPDPALRNRMDPSAVYAVEYIAASSIEKLFTFKVTEEVLRDLEKYAALSMKRTADREFKSLKVLRMLCS